MICGNGDPLAFFPGCGQKATGSWLLRRRKSSSVLRLRHCLCRWLQWHRTENEITYRVSDIEAVARHPSKIMVPRVELSQPFHERQPANSGILGHVIREVEQLVIGV